MTLAALYAYSYDAINAEHDGPLLQLPLSKWCAIVEAWAWRNTDPKNHPKLTTELDRAVDFTWINASEDGRRYDDPARWQTNTKGESLLSVHRRKPAEGR